MGAAGYVEELLGVRGCELIGSATKVDCGRRLQQFDLRYRGPVPARAPSAAGRCTATARGPSALCRRHTWASRRGSR